MGIMPRSALGRTACIVTGTGTGDPPRGQVGESMGTTCLEFSLRRMSNFVATFAFLPQTANDLAFKVRLPPLSPLPCPYA